MEVTIIVPIAHTLPELPDALAQRAAHLGQLAHAEEQDDDEGDDR